MDVREYFDSVRDAQQSINGRLESIASMREREGLRAQRYDLAGGGSGNHDAMRATDIRMDAEAAARQELEDLYAIIADGREICRGIRAANPTHRIWGDVLEFRYCDAMQWKQVGRALGICIRKAQIEHDNALDWVETVGIARARTGMGQAELPLTS